MSIDGVKFSPLYQQPAVEPRTGGYNPFGVQPAGASPLGVGFEGFRAPANNGTGELSPVVAGSDLGNKFDSNNVSAAPKAENSGIVKGGLQDQYRNGQLGFFDALQQLGY